MIRILTISCMVALLVGAVGAESVKSFCEYGTGVSERLGAGGAKWIQNWGYSSWDWFDCDASPNVGILNECVTGVLETNISGAPNIDPSSLVLKLPFGGMFTLNAYDPMNPNKIVGQIKGDIAGDKVSGQFDGLFVADLNATRAVVDPVAGTITIKFGAAVTSAPGTLITITETTGKFKSITPVGKWELHVSGTVTLALVPSLPLQTNIMAGLMNPALLLGAQEEIVLTGSYYRGSPNK